MKKFTSLLLTVCTAFSVSAAFTACDGEETAHKHAYETAWSKDETHHWHACEGKDCETVADKAEHAWNDGEITTQPSASEEGVKTFACACGQTKTEPVPYVVESEVTAEEWAAALSLTNENNYKIVSVSGTDSTVCEFDGTTVHVVATHGTSKVETYSTKDGDAYTDYHLSNGVLSVNGSSEQSYQNAKSLGLDLVFLFKDFTYDLQTKTYTAAAFDFNEGIKYTDVSLSFENKKFKSGTFKFIYGNNAPAESSVTIEYGTVETIALPTNTVDEAQMTAAFEAARDNAVSKRVTLTMEGASMYFIISGNGYSYSIPNGSEFVFINDGLKIYDRAYDETAGAWGAWSVKTSASEASYLQSFNYMNKPNLYLQYYAPASFADMKQAADGGYEYTVEDSDYDSYKVYFINGKLTKFIAYNGSDYETLSYEYGDFTVEAPEVEA